MKRRSGQQTRRVRREVAPSLAIALCIPFDIKDVKYILQCLKSIAHQTRQPDLVVMSFSRIPDWLQEKIQGWIDRFPLIPTVHALFSTEQQFAGKNRNLAATYAIEQGADIVSFIDSDDIAHPRRLEIIERAFLRDAALEAVLHSYSSIYKEPVSDFSTLTWPGVRGRIYTNCFYVLKRQISPWRLFTIKDIGAVDPTAELIQNGHLSLRAATWKERPYNEELRVGEDSDYNARLCDEGVRMAMIADKLVLYLYERERPAPPAEPKS